MSLLESRQWRAPSLRRTSSVRPRFHFAHGPSLFYFSLKNKKAEIILHMIRMTRMTKGDFAASESIEGRASWAHIDFAKREV